MTLIREDRLALLYQMSHVIHSTLDPHEALHLIIGEAVRLTKASSGSVVLVNPTTDFLEIHASKGLPVGAGQLHLKVGEGITGWVARTGKAARVSDVSTDPRYVLLNPATQSELAVPLDVRGEIRGVINVDSDELDAFSAEDLGLLEEFAVHAARVIQHTWLYEQVRLKARLFESLVNVSQVINSTLNLTDALSVITSEACTLMSARMSSLLMLDDSGEWLELKASSGAGEAYIGKPPVSVSESLVGIVVRRKKPVQVENVQSSGRYQNVSIARAEGLVSLLSVPLQFEGDAIGVLNVYTGVPHNFSNEETSILSALATLSAVALQKARLYERVVDLEEQLRQAEKLSALGLLAAEVAHEIRNPLTVMKMLFHSLNLEFAADDPRTRDAEIMENKMNHLNRIVEQVLDFARSTEPTPAAIDLNKLIDELGLLVRHKLKNQRIEFVRELSVNLPPVFADAVQMEQAFLNLTLNAAEAMPGGGRLTIQTQVVQAAGSETGPSGNRVVEVIFRDTGGGMTEEQCRRAFSSLLNTTKARGTGLGLAIVKRVIETHQGTVSLVSKLGEGTSIRLALPIA